MNSSKNIKSARRRFSADYPDSAMICFRIRAARAIRGNILKCLFLPGLLFCLFAPVSTALDSSERAFIWNEANAQMQNARTQADYLRAASIYQHLIDDGVRNGPLFYNIGTAMLAADRPEPAVDAFERAERYLGRQADIQHNLQIAHARKAKSATVDLPWYRLAAFWHFYLSAPQRSSIAVFAFLLGWGALTLRRLGIRRMTGGIALIGLLVCVVLVTSVAASWQLEGAERRYNLVIPPAAASTNAAVNPAFGN